MWVVEGGYGWLGRYLLAASESLLCRNRAGPGACADLQLLEAPSATHLAYRPGMPLTAAVWRGGKRVVQFILDAPIDQRAQDRPTLSVVPGDGTGATSVTTGGTAAQGGAFQP